MEYKYFLLEILENHRGKAIGVLLGLAFGWFAIIYGFFEALFVSLCIVVGYFIGKRIDEQADVKQIFNKLFRKR